MGHFRSGLELMSGIMALLAASGGGAGSSGASFTPVAGTYLVTDNGPGGIGATFTITATVAVVWNFTISGGATSNVTNGTSASSITFTCAQGLNNKTATITVSADGLTWNLTLTAIGTGGGAVMTL